MTLTSGTRLGPYEIQSPLGAGGMGEVYRARDTKLNRDVAVKVVPEQFISDPERMTRFEREAQVLAAFNHSAIAAIYGLEDSGHTRALIMELVEGPTLAHRIGRGRMPLEEVLSIAQQIAEALEYAHEKGITHRDLKPANIKVTPDGGVKVLDFGLAKVLQGDAGTGSDPSNSPTFTSASTQAGMILGTAAYMSPEQAKGKAVDRRTDVWAFGCLLFEMLSGKRAFEGETVTETLANVIKEDPKWQDLPPETPQLVRELLRRCLEKDPRRRLQAIGEARIAVQDTLTAPKETSSSATAARSSGPSKSVVPWAIAAILTVALGLALAAWWNERGRPAQAEVQFELGLAPGDSLNLEGHSPIAISPDGTQVAYALHHGSTTQLYVRSLDRLDATPVAGTDGAYGPFFSPDGQWIGFFAGGKVLKVPVSGGPVVELCSTGAAIQPRGASWGTDGQIYASTSATGGLVRLPAAGGNPQPATTLDEQKKERSHRWPQVLPDGKHVLFTVGTLDSPEYYDDSEIDVVDVATGKRNVVFKGASMALYVPTGHLVFARGGQLYKVPFDAARMQATGDATLLLHDVSGDSTTGAAFFSISGTGNLVYVRGVQANDQSVLAWADSSGVVTELAAPPHEYRDIQLSPDGRHVAVGISERTLDGWIYDIANKTLNRLTFEGQNQAFIWTPDSQRVVFTSNIAGQYYLKSVPADGSGPPESLIGGTPTQLLAHSVSPDGKCLSYTSLSNTRAPLMMMLPLVGEHKPVAFSATDSAGTRARFSPDGRWLAYTVRQAAHMDVFVQPYPPTGGRWQISTEGGDEPRWSRDGKELFYRDGNDSVMVVPVDTKSGFKAGATRLFFKGLHRPAGATENYSVSPDGHRILILRPVQGAQPSSVVMILNWFDELQRGGERR
ncbi:MAG: serine/threonine-protein kinase [Acidobacteriia bacterium]|nr:serine/threonine-protein kinase [Terriglobia bacterium]